MYELAKDVKNIEAIHISELESDETRLKLKRINSARKISIFAHGSSYPLNCFYRKFKSPNDEQIPIHNAWWAYINSSMQSVYFHVCHGARIIAKNDILRNNFKAWVSYSNIVDSIQASFIPIRKIQRTFLYYLSEALRKRKNSKALKASIEAAYKNMESQLYDEGEYLPGYTTLLTIVGKNMEILEHS